MRQKEPTIAFTIVQITAVRPEDANPTFDTVSGTLDNSDSSRGFCQILIKGDSRRQTMAINLEKSVIERAFAQSGGRGVIIGMGAALPNGDLNTIVKQGGTRVYPVPEGMKRRG